MTTCLCRGSHTHSHHARVKSLFSRYSEPIAFWPICPPFAAGDLDCASPQTYTSWLLHRRKSVDFGMFFLVLCFAFAFVVVFTFPAIIHFQCFQAILWRIFLLPWGPESLGCSTHPLVLHRIQGICTIMLVLGSGFSLRSSGIWEHRGDGLVVISHRSSLRDVVSRHLVITKGLYVAHISEHTSLENLTCGFGTSCFPCTVCVSPRCPAFRSSLSRRWFSQWL